MTSCTHYATRSTQPTAHASTHAARSAPARWTMPDAGGWRGREPTRARVPCIIDAPRELFSLFILSYAFNRVSLWLHEEDAMSKCEARNGLWRCGQDAGHGGAHKGYDEDAKVALTWTYGAEAVPAAVAGMLAEGAAIRGVEICEEGKEVPPSYERATKAIREAVKSSIPARRCDGCAFYVNRGVSVNTWIASDGKPRHEEVDNGGECARYPRRTGVGPEHWCGEWRERP